MSETTQTATHVNPDEVSAFVDGELSPGESQRIQQHLADCHGCALRVLSATQLKAATSRAGERFAPPPEALARLTGQIRQQKPAKPARIYTFRAPFRSIAWTALAATLLLTISLLGWHENRQSNTLTAELLDQHLATLSSAASPQVVSTDRHTVKPWFQGKLPFSFNLPEPTALPADTTLQGADLAYLNGQPAALLLFTIHKHEVSIFVTQRSGFLPLSAKSTRAGFTLRSSHTKDLQIIAISDVNPADLDALVSVLTQVQ